MRNSLYQSLTAALFGAAVFLCGCTHRTALDQAIASADEQAWERASPGLLERLRLGTGVEVVPVAPKGESGLMTGYATPRVHASRIETPQYAYPLHRAPEEGITATRRAIEEEELLDEFELCWLEDSLEAYLIQVNGSAVIDWVDADGRVTGESATVVWSKSNGHAYESLGRMAIDAGLASADEMSLARLRALHRSHTDVMAGLMLENPRYIMFRLLDADEPLCGSRVRPLIAGVSLATDPAYPTDTLLLIEPTDGTMPCLGLVHDGGAAIVGPQRVDRYFGSGAEAMGQAGALAAPITVSEIKLIPPREK